MKKKVIYILSALVFLIIVLIVYSSTGKDEEIQLEAQVERGDFEIIVLTTGELQAKNSVEIKAPAELRNRDLRFREIKIQDLVAEGTVVDSGDWVATLDRTEANTRLQDQMDELEKTKSQYEKTRLDTTLQLRNLRDELINLKYEMEEREITLEQSKYEPPATIRQAKINLDKAQRAYEQAQKNYTLKERQSIADMKEVAINLSKQQRIVNEMEDVIARFEIHAPAPGMVIYKREWNGEKRKVGASINPWDLVVAELPDMSTMISKTYVNEIDISKVKRGQPVRIGVDAFPDREYTGVIQEVANIGEQLPNSDARVFEVIIHVDGTDPILRPSMTTSNSILTSKYPDVLYIPLECVHTEDSIPFIYHKKGYKQIVVLGETNENHVMVEKGLEEAEKIYLTVPENSDQWKIKGEDLIEVIKQKEEEKKLKEVQRKEEAENQRIRRQSKTSSERKGSEEKK